RRRAVLGIAALSALLIGCTTNKYHSTAIVPLQTANLIQSRTLADPELKRFVQSKLGQTQQPWPPQSWSPAELMLAALYFSPDLDVARTEIAVAEPGVITAGPRPNPTLDIAPGYSTSPHPWLFAALIGLP